MQREKELHYSSQDDYRLNGHLEVLFLRLLSPFSIFSRRHHYT